MGIHICILQICDFPEKQKIGNHFAKFLSPSKQRHRTIRHFIIVIYFDEIILLLYYNAICANHRKRTQYGGHFWFYVLYALAVPIVVENVYYYVHHMDRTDKTNFPLEYWPHGLCKTNAQKFIQSMINYYAI